MFSSSEQSKSGSSVSMRWCHHCRAKKIGVQCTNTSAPGRAGLLRTCLKVFCDSCLQKYYGQSLEAATRNPEWICPYCLETCVCSHCVAAAQRRLQDQLNPAITAPTTTVLVNKRAKKKVRTLLAQAQEIFHELESVIDDAILTSVERRQQARNCIETVTQSLNTLSFMTSSSSNDNVSTSSLQDSPRGSLTSDSDTTDDSQHEYLDAHVRQSTTQVMSIQSLVNPQA
eukprot:GILJ01003026.1.p1 GENE.GILJ01003026.1~~GILJ01003026.1.p1  ORF type:complete len:228 (-),score=24.74 GILJ01003026.1:608-1291(-)